MIFCAVLMLGVRVGDIWPQLTVADGSAHVSQPLADVLRKAGPELRVRSVLRDGSHYLAPLPDVLIQAGDRLLVRGTIDSLREFEALLDIEPLTQSAQPSAGSTGDVQLAEVAVTLASPLRGTRIDDVQFDDRHRLDIVALHSAGGVQYARAPGMHEHRLRAGDVLLIQGWAEDINRLKLSGELLVLDTTMELPRTRRAPLALLIMLAVIALAALRILPIAASALLGVMAMLGTGCLRWRDIGNALNLQVILIIVASLALGLALMRTGGADWLALGFLASTFGAPPWLALAGLMLLMALLTNIVSNNAAAVIGTPIAINIAMELFLPLEPFVLAVLFGANLSFVTPMAYKTNILVMNAGGYRFGDFVRAGTPLTLIMWALLSVILSTAYGLW